MKPIVVIFLTCSLLFSTALIAQTGSTTGSINGVVTDNTTSTLPGVTVTVTNTETGLTRTEVTQSNGSYLIELLPPGRYRVGAELEGLGRVARENVTVLLGTSSKVNLTLTPQVAEEITVTAAAPVVDATESGSKAAVTQDQIENLPLLGRDFRDLILLTPGANEAAFGGRVVLNGAKGIATDFNIDGADANNDFFGEQRGGIEQPFSFSQAAIREFQVIRSAYSAEFGKGVGATMNAITKSGTNDLEGQIFYFLRDKEWAEDRPDTIAGQPVADSFEGKNSDQYGLALGGPIVRDRYHYFVNADLQDISERVTVDDVRNDPDFMALPEATRTAFMTSLESLLGHPFDQELGYTTQEDQQTYLLKLDANLADRHHLSFRDNYSEFHNFPSESPDPLSSQGDEYSTFNTAVLQAESVLTSSLYNQLIFQVSKDERPIEPVNDELPFVQIFGSAPIRFGQRDFLPNNTIERKWQFKDALAYVRDRHHFKMGVEYMSSDILNFFPRELSGEYQFNSIADFINNRPSRFEQGMGPNNGANRFDYVTYGMFLQDTWRPTEKLTLDLGFRWDLQDLPLPKRNIAPQYPEFLDNFENDNDNIAPRFGFAYDLKGNGRSVIRGGAGKYFNFLPSILLAGPISEIAGEYNRIAPRCTTSDPCPTFPNIFSPEEFATRVRTGGDVSILGDNFEAQESWRTSLGFEQQLGRAYSVGIDGVYQQLDKQFRLVNINASPTGVVYGNLVVYNTTSPNRRYPAFANVRRVGNDAEGDFKSATLFFKKVAIGESRFSWLGHYTWSEATDQDNSERSTSTSGSIDPFNPDISEGRTDNDVTHKALLSGSYEFPFGILVSAIYNWRTGYPWTPTASGLSNGLSGIGPFTPVFVDGDGEVIDLTAASGSTPAELSAFLAARNGTLQERNTEEQPDFQNLDMRIAKRFGLTGGFAVELIAEIFNVLNDQIEFISGRNQAMFNASFSSSTSKWTITRNANFALPNAYNFSSNPRQFQAAVKLHF